MGDNSRTQAIRDCFGLGTNRGERDRPNPFAGRSRAIRSIHRAADRGRAVSANVLLGIVLLAPATAAAQNPIVRGLPHSGGAVCSEGGTHDRWFSLSHGTFGDDTVTVELAAGDSSVATVQPTSFTFEPDPTIRTKNFTVACVEDNVLTNGVYGNARTTTITLTASSNTAHWNGVTASMTVENHDNEPWPVTLQEGFSTIRVLSVVFESTNDITVTATSSDPDIVSVTPATYTWVHANADMHGNGLTKIWSLQAVDDDVYHGERTAVLWTASRSPAAHSLQPGRSPPWMTTTGTTRRSMWLWALCPPR